MTDLVRIELPQLILPDAAILAGQLAPSSIAEYRTDIAAYLAWCQSSDLPPLAAPSLAQWRTHQAQATTLSAATINRALAAVKRLVKEAASQGYLSADLAAQFHGVAGVVSNRWYSTENAGLESPLSIGYAGSQKEGPSDAQERGLCRDQSTCPARSLS